MTADPRSPVDTRGEAAWIGLALLAAVVGLALLADTLGRSSATYDETLYIQTAARWWRTGDQEDISRAGSPLAFWKMQQAPVLWILDHTGRKGWIDDPGRHEAELLVWVRAGSLWIWALALGVTAIWSRACYGPRALALAAWWFALSPNLLAHGSLATMELPVTAAFTLASFLFWLYLKHDRGGWLALCGLCAGLAFACKFTAILLPPLLAAAEFLITCSRRGWRSALARALATGCVLLPLLVLGDILATGFATLPASRQVGSHPLVEQRFQGATARILSRLLETPIPQDWVGLSRQMIHQHSGANGYLLGERRTHGWPHYYLVALAVKAPPLLWLALAARLACRRRLPHAPARALPIIIALLFFAAASIASSRNFGLRYLLPIAPLVIVWLSGLAEAGRAGRVIALVALAGQAVAVSSVHPHELTYFNVFAGGAQGGRRVLADSNLDWGQGLKSLAELQRRDPRLRDLTLYYFGDTDPARYGVAGQAYVVHAERTEPDFPQSLACKTAYLAVSASLAWGPWGPEDFFQELRPLEPVAWTDDSTIAVYRTSDLETARRARGSRSPAPAAAQ